MFKHLFDLRYERNEYEAVVFYFFYIILGYYIAGLCFCLSKIFYSDFLYLLIFFVPFIFYTFISVSIICKKNIKNFNSICLVFYTITITILPPVGLLIFLECLVGFKDMTRHDILWGLLGTFVIWLLPSIALGGIPGAILTMKEDCSLKKEIEQMEQEKLEQARRVERQLLIERTRRIEQEELENIDNNE